jgi:hypothetical protein
MTTHPPQSDDYLIDGVICPGRICRLLAPYLTRDVRAAAAQFGEVDAEVAAFVRAVERAGDRYTTCAQAGSPDGGNRASFADASNGDAGPGQSAQSDYDPLTTADAATRLGLTSSAVRDAVKHGRLTAVRRSPYLFDPAEVDRFATTRRQPAQQLGTP